MQVTPGKVAAEAEAAKRQRYGDGSGGVIVTPAAMESWGTFGQNFEQLLQQLEANLAYLLHHRLLPHLPCLLLLSSPFLAAFLLAPSLIADFMDR